LQPGQPQGDLRQSQPNSAIIICCESIFGRVPNPQIRPRTLGLIRLSAKIVFNPDAEIVTQTKEMVSDGLPVSPFPRKGWAVTRGPNSGPLNGYNGSKEEEAYEKE